MFDAGNVSLPSLHCSSAKSSDHLLLREKGKNRETNFVSSLWFPNNDVDDYFRIVWNYQLRCVQPYDARERPNKHAAI
jgi:hypothetical protein